MTNDEKRFSRRCLSRHSSFSPLSFPATSTSPERLAGFVIASPMDLRNLTGTNSCMTPESSPTQPRGVEHAHVIDIVAHDEKTGEVALIMLEPRAWDGSELQMFQLQEKL